MKSLKRLANRFPVAPVIAAMFAAVVAALVIAMPHWLFEYYVQRVGLPALIPAATPPLGDTARMMAAAAALVLSFAVFWVLASLAEKLLAAQSAKRAPIGSDMDFSRPIVSAGPPTPLNATSELGAPLMSDEAITQARDELMLETAMIEPEPVETVVEDVATPVAPVPIDPDYGAANVVETPVARLPIGAESLSTLMGRLERGLLNKPAGWRPRAARSATR